MRLGAGSKTKGQEEVRRSDLDPDVLAEFKRLQESALSKVQIAIGRGLLPRVSTQHTTRPEEITPVECVDCGIQAQHYDHRDYLEPLVVEPVCQPCNHKRGLATDTFTKHPEYWADLKQRSPDERLEKARTGGRPATGKPLTVRLIRLDDDVWAECQRLGKEHGTINEGLRAQLLKPPPVRINISELSGVPTYCPACGRKDGHSLACSQSKEPVETGRTWKRGPRQKGDKSR